MNSKFKPLATSVTKAKKPVKYVPSKDVTQKKELSKKSFLKRFFPVFFPSSPIGPLKYKTGEIVKPYVEENFENSEKRVPKPVATKIVTSTTLSKPPVVEQGKPPGKLNSKDKPKLINTAEMLPTNDHSLPKKEEQSKLEKPASSITNKLPKKPFQSKQKVVPKVPIQSNPDPVATKIESIPVDKIVQSRKDKEDSVKIKSCPVEQKTLPALVETKMDAQKPTKLVLKPSKILRLIDSEPINRLIAATPKVIETEKVVAFDSDSETSCCVIEDDRDESDNEKSSDSDDRDKPLPLVPYFTTENDEPSESDYIVTTKPRRSHAPAKEKKPIVFTLKLQFRIKLPKSVRSYPTELDLRMIE